MAAPCPGQPLMPGEAWVSTVPITTAQSLHPPAKAVCGVPALVTPSPSPAHATGGSDESSPIPILAGGRSTVETITKGLIFQKAMFPLRQLSEGSEDSREFHPPFQ